MIANAAFLAALSVFLFAGWLAGELRFLAPYKTVLFHEHAALVVLGDGRVRERGIQEEQRIRILTLKRGTDSAEVLHDELRQEVPQLRRLRLIARSVVYDGLCSADLVDSHDERLHL